MIRTLKLRSSLVYRMGMLRGALLERIRYANEVLQFADKLEALAMDQGAEPDGMEAAADELEALAGVGTKSRKRAIHGQEAETG